MTAHFIKLLWVLLYLEYRRQIQTDRQTALWLLQRVECNDFFNKGSLCPEARAIARTGVNITFNREIALTKQDLPCGNCNTSDSHFCLHNSALSCFFYPNWEIWHAKAKRNSAFRLHRSWIARAIPYNYEQSLVQIRAHVRIDAFAQISSWHELQVYPSFQYKFLFALKVRYFLKSLSPRFLRIWCIIIPPKLDKRLVTIWKKFIKN